MKGGKKKEPNQELPGNLPNIGSLFAQRYVRGYQKSCPCEEKS